ncbi:hypothetical protein BC832DRAFT_551054 [Gaertneriomyces semiglobifer]|nr:hypothetical protein BC832DRAFT_551054 [Gaertneriomyces semiglobifer]
MIPPIPRTIFPASEDRRRQMAGSSAATSCAYSNGHTVSRERRGERIRYIRHQGRGLPAFPHAFHPMPALASDTLTETAWELNMQA